MPNAEKDRRALALQEMGFPHQDVTKALQDTNYALEEAANLLVERSGQRILPNTR
jgi:uncharacterized UBP type Zn finger protein